VVVEGEWEWLSLWDAGAQVQGAVGVMNEVEVVSLELDGRIDLDGVKLRQFLVEKI